MSSPIQKQFVELIQLLTLGKFKEAFDLLEKISKMKGLSKEDQLNCLLLKSEVEYLIPHASSQFPLYDIPH